MNIKYPTKCEIINPAGHKFAGYDCAVPIESVPHIGKKGTAYKDDQGCVVIVLEDDSIIYGHQCWWVPE